jgi:hypothetical protein
MHLDHLFAPQVSSNLRPLRDYQQKAKETIISELDENASLRAVAVAATGAGKTVIFCHLIHEMIAGGKKVAVLVFDKTLIDQTVKRLRENGITHIGVIQGAHPGRDDSAPVQVISVQTLASRCGEKSKYRVRQKPWQADVYIVDEAHKNSEYLFKLMKEMPDKAFLGFSATPSTKGLGKHYTKLISIATTKELIDAGWLSDFICYAPAQSKIETAISGVAIKAGEYVQDQLGDAVNTPEIVGDILTHWKKYADGLQTLVFCVNRKHARHVSEVFYEASIAVSYIDGETPDDERRTILKKFENKETQVIVNVGVLTTGFDAYVECLVDAKPTRSKILFCQTWGRALRPKDGKKAIFLDHAGNALRLGLPTHITFDNLDTGERNQSKRRVESKNTEPLPVLCPECSAVIPRVHEACPQCGYKKPTLSKVKQLPGMLIEWGSNSGPDENDVWRERYRIAAELKYIIEQRGSKPGRLFFLLKDYFDIKFPHGHAIFNVEPARASRATWNWFSANSRKFAQANGGGGYVSRAANG